MNKALFLDRDGTVIQDAHYLHKVEDVSIIYGAESTIEYANRKGYLVFFITNQSGIGRGYFTDQDFVATNNYILGKLYQKNGATVHGTYYCPYHPTKALEQYKVDSFCRKPNPGMLLTAATDWGIDLDNSIMVGDKESDLLAGIKAGCKSILVRTGYGKKTENKLSTDVKENIIILDSILKVWPHL